MAALNWSVFCVTLALILSMLHPCHSIRLLLTCIVMDTHALVADPHFSVPHCRSLFSIIHLTCFFSPLVPFFSPFFPFMSPITTPFYISHYVTLLLRHAFFPLFSFLSLLTASGCKCPACMNTVWGWSYYPKGCACSRLPRRSSSAWRPWSSSASVSHPGPWVMTRMSTQHVKYNCNRVQPYFRELMGWIKSVRVTVVFWLCGHSASAGPEEPELFWQTADLLHQGARPFGQPPRRDHPHAETVSAHAAAGLPPVGNTHNRIPKNAPCCDTGHGCTCHFFRVSAK